MPLASTAVSHKGSVLLLSKSAKPPGAKIFYTTEKYKSKEEIHWGGQAIFYKPEGFRWISLMMLFSTSLQTISGNNDYFFLILPEEREDERDEEDRVRIEEDFDIRGEDVLLNDREEVDDLILGEVDLI